MLLKQLCPAFWKGPVRAWATSLNPLNSEQTLPDGKTLTLHLSSPVNSDALCVSALQLQC